MRRAAGVLAVAALLGAAVPAHAARVRSRPAPDYVADGNLAEWRGTPTNLAGRMQISRGELVYTDFLYDDYGADRNGTPDQPDFSGSTSATAGDYRYPPEPARYGYNAADLRELRVAADGRALHLLAGLQTMQVRDAAVVTVALDTDGNPATGAAAWPDGAGLRGGGADRFVTFTGASGRVTDAAGAARPVRVGSDLVENAIEVSVPLDALGPIAPGARIWAAVGIATPTGGFASQASGAAAAFDVAMPGDDDWPRLTDHWGDHRQAVKLASGDIGSFALPLDVRALQERRSRGFRIEPGFYNAVFRSSMDLGEGIDLKQDAPSESGGLAGYARPAYRSRWQPYAVWIPPAWRTGRKLPTLLYGHPQGYGHNLYRTVSPDSLRMMSEARNSIVFTPLGRGTDSWYLDSSLVDVLEAWRDVRRRFRADPDRTSLGGYSMGGYLSYRLGLLMPDAFARVSLYVGPPAYFTWVPPEPQPRSTPEWRIPGWTTLIVDNALNLPYQMTDSTADELVPISGVLAHIDAFRAAGNPYRFYQHSTDEHFSYIVADSIGRRTNAWLGDARRDLSPVEVRYKRYPSMDLPRYGLRFDGAYWVDEMDVRDARAVDSFGEVWATNFARGGFRRRVVADPPSSSVGESGASPAAVSGQHVENGAAVAKANGFEARLQNLAKITFLTDRMGLDRTKPVTATLRGDGTTTVRLTGPWPRRLTATFDGRPVTVSRERDGTIAVTVAASGTGAHTLRIA
jgi:predicted esterase